ncbi:acyltransferase [Methylocystis echinoides]|uniref:acyltransferase family protein n=1 Tax=Methylocystis echinoides TaxID=29468 RepID=UPI00342E8417
MSEQRTTIYSLQAGRALAAIAVVVHHAALAARDFGGGLRYEDIFSLGYLGVDFFFVLSGFIIYYSTVGRSKSAADYARSRAVRIYFPYLPIGLAIAILYWLLPGASLGDRQWNWLTTITLAPIGAPALSVAWTLQHEVMFYALFGIFYFSGRLFLGLFLWFGAIAANGLIGAVDVIPLRPIDLEFLFGVAAAVMAQRGRWHVAMAPAALICFVLWGFQGFHRESSVLVGLGFALLVPVIVAAEREQWLRIPRTYIFLGAASYSIYLSHGLAISIAARILHGSWVIMIGSTLAGVLGGVAYYLVIERPILNLAGSRKVPARSKARDEIHAE